MQVDVRGQASRALRRAMAGCLGGAALALLAMALLHQPLAGVALAVGILLGSANGWLAARSVGSARLSFSAASAGRLGLLTLLGCAMGWIFMPAWIWLVLLGLGLAQLVLAASAVGEAVRA